MEDRKVVIKAKLSDWAKYLKYEIEVDSFDDVDHNGYNSRDVRSMNLRLPAELDQADKIFPHAVARALEDAERDAYAVAIRKYKINAIKESLEKIDLTGGGAEYQHASGDMVSAKAGILDVEIKEDEDLILMTILNPEHLINSVINGMGYFAPDLSTEEPETEAAISAKIHNLADYFNVYGERQPSGDLPSQYSPDVNDEYFNSLLKENVENLDLAEVAEAVKEAIESEVLEPKEALDLAHKYTGTQIALIKNEILEGLKDQVISWTNKLG